eukprot:TRINITY_DN9663_c0_g1_i3.p1 TRINITY_DN9663_c0_g1~~TRINITY_DN9663_c0_g1_i3.p1  ORF type:complete len:383 (+),score=93.85 TRINITY_DN9663_c0_g1_i3:60-1208(+)
MSAVGEEEEAVLRLAEASNAQDDPNIAAELEKQRVALGDKTEAHANGGLVFTNATILAFQRKVMWEFMKEVGWNIASGKSADVTRISLPVKIFEPRSFLQRLTDAWSLAPLMLNKASQLSDPVERVKCVLAFALGALKQNCKQWKPFNPILGETYQAQYSDGTLMFLEQTSHHPPVSHWQMFGPNDSFQFFGYALWEASMMGNALKGTTHGPNVVAFPDGDKISFTIPYLWLRGILWGDRVAEFHGEMTVQDKRNKVTAKIKFNPDAVSYLASWFVTQSSPVDVFRGTIEQDGRVVSKIEGSWLTHLDFDGERFVEFSSEVQGTVKPMPDEVTLPSDARFRADLLALAQGDYELAQHQKVVLEEIQRNDRKLRKQHWEDVQT